MRIGFFTKAAIASMTLLVGVLAFHSMFPGGVNIARLWDTDTMLGVGDSKIAGIEHEFVRRSPRMQALLAEFKQCTPKCSDDFYRRRDEAIQAEWPEIYKRVSIEKDWLVSPTNGPARTQTKAIVSRYGKDGATLCKPQITFINTPGKAPAYSRFEGFSCKPPGVRAGG